MTSSVERELSMEWTDVEPDQRATPVNELRADLVLEIMRALARKRFDSPFVFIDRGTRESVSRQVAQCRTEQGGLLIGEVIELDRTILAVYVTGAVRGNSLVSTPTALEMSPDVWISANERCSGPAERVVGWYHCHPGIGAFFSDTDRRTQRSLFPHSYSVGLVMDPIRHEEKWYIGPEAVAVACTQVGDFPPLPVGDRREGESVGEVVSGDRTAEEPAEASLWQRICADKRAYSVVVSSLLMALLFSLIVLMSLD